MRRVALALALPLSLLAARAARAEKIAYVDVQRVILEVEEGKAAKARLKVEVETKRGELSKKEKELSELKADYDRQQGVLTEDAKTQKQQEMNKKYQEAQLLARQMQEEIAGKEEEAMRSISEKLLQVVQEVSDKDGFNLVLKKEALLNGPLSSDITNEVVRRYNDRFGGKKGKKSAQATPAAKKEE